MRRLDDAFGLARKFAMKIESPYLRLAALDAAVGLVLVNSNDQTNAMTVSMFSELAHHPASLWVSIARSSYTHELIERAGQFTLVVLTHMQKEIAIACGTTSGRERNKCSSLSLYRSAGGFHFMEGVISSTGCRVREKLELSDGHTVYMADIVEGEIDSRKSQKRHLLLSDF